MNNIEKVGYILTIVLYLFLPVLVSSVWHLLGNETVDTLWAGTLAFLWFMAGFKVSERRKKENGKNARLENLECKKSISKRIKSRITQEGEKRKWEKGLK